MQYASCVVNKIYIERLKINVIQLYVCMYVSISELQKNPSLYIRSSDMSTNQINAHTHICFTRAYEMFFLVDYSFQSEHGICRSCIYNSLPEYRSRFYDFIMIHF